MKKKWLFAAILIPLLLFALSRLDAESLLQSARQIPAWLLALLLGLQVVSQLLVNLQWHQISRFTAANISFADMFYINCQGAVVDSITPGVKVGGEVTRAVQISRMGNCTGEQAAAMVALQKIFSMGAFFVINLFTVGYLVGSVPFLQVLHVQFFVYALLLLFLLLFAGIFAMPRHITKWLHGRREGRFLWMRKVRGFLFALLDHVVLIRANAKVMISLSLLSFLIWLLYPVKMYILAAQVFPGIHAIYIGATTFASYMVAMIPIFPGGLGGFEGTMSGLLFAMGFAASGAVVVTVLFRFVTFWFVMLLGLGFVGWRKARGAFRRWGETKRGMPKLSKK